MADYFYGEMQDDEFKEARRIEVGSPTVATHATCYLLVLL